MPVDARRLIRKMRGGAQAHLIEAADGHAYVVKFANNPQHRRILVNEWIAAVFLKYLGIATPEATIVQVTAEFLEQNPGVRFHFTPTYSSWLNQVEIWFAKIQRDVIDRGVFTSVADLSRKLRKYIRAYAKSARPFRWTYTDPRHRIKVSQ